jgi:hypothetical protein
MTSDIQEKGTKEFVEFATTTFRGLLTEDESVVGVNSDLRVLARLDISVYWHSVDKRYRFFVNEIAYTHKAVLFLSYMHEEGHRVAADLAAALRGLVALNRLLEARNPPEL